LAYYYLSNSEECWQLFRAKATFTAKRRVNAEVEITPKYFNGLPIFINFHVKNNSDRSFVTRLIFDLEGDSSFTVLFDFIVNLLLKHFVLSVIQETVHRDDIGGI
jgi:hypothetical protein